MFGNALVCPLRAAQKVFFDIDATRKTSRRDNSPAGELYCDLSRNMQKPNREFFSAAITQFVANIAVGLPSVSDGAIDVEIAQFLSEVLAPHVAAELKEKRDETARRP